MSPVYIICSGTDLTSSTSTWPLEELCEVHELDMTAGRCTCTARRNVITISTSSGWAASMVEIRALPLDRSAIERTPLRAWHHQRAIGRHVKAQLPRGRCRYWRSLKDKRRAWGLA